MGKQIDIDELKEFILEGKEIAKQRIDITKLFGLKDDEMRYEGYDKAFDYVLEHIKAKENEDAIPFDKSLKYFINEEIETSAYDLKVIEGIPDSDSLKNLFKGMIMADKRILTYIERFEHEESN